MLQKLFEKYKVCRTVTKQRIGRAFQQITSCHCIPLTPLLDILVNMLKKEKKRATDALSGAKRATTPRQQQQQQQRSMSSNAAVSNHDSGFSRNAPASSGGGGGSSGSGSMHRVASSQSVSDEKVKRQVCK